MKHKDSETQIQQSISTQSSKQYTNASDVFRFEHTDRSYDVTIPNTSNRCSNVSQYLGSALVARSFSDESTVLTRSQVNLQCFQRIRLTRLLHSILSKQTLELSLTLCVVRSQHRCIARWINSLTSNCCQSWIDFMMLTSMSVQKHAAVVRCGRVLLCYNHCCGYPITFV